MFKELVLGIEGEPVAVASGELDAALLESDVELEFEEGRLRSRTEPSCGAFNLLLLLLSTAPAELVEKEQFSLLLLVTASSFTRGLLEVSTVEGQGNLSFAYC